MTNEDSFWGRQMVGHSSPEAPKTRFFSSTSIFSERVFFASIFCPVASGLPRFLDPIQPFFIKVSRIIRKGLSHFVNVVPGALVLRSELCSPDTNACFSYHYPGGSGSFSLIPIFNKSILGPNFSN
jgi:hypothetical protein